MIRKEEYERVIQETSLLMTGKPPTKAFSDAVYDRINNWFIIGDLQKASEVLMHQEGIRLTYPALHKQLVHFRAIRIEEQARQDQREDRAFADNMSTANPGLYAMFEAVCRKDKTALEEYGIREPFLVSNAVLITKDGRHRKCIIDDNDPRFEGAVSMRREPAGEQSARQMVLDTSKFKPKFLDDELRPPEETGWKARKPGENEFIPGFDD